MKYSLILLVFSTWACGLQVKKTSASMDAPNSAPLKFVFGNGEWRDNKLILPAHNCEFFYYEI